MYLLITWNKRRALAASITEANRITRTLIAFGAVNVSIHNMSAGEVAELF